MCIQQYIAMCVPVPRLGRKCNGSSNTLAVLLVEYLYHTTVVHGTRSQARGWERVIPGRWDLERAQNPGAGSRHAMYFEVVKLGMSVTPIWRRDVPIVTFVLGDENVASPVFPVWFLARLFLFWSVPIKFSLFSSFVPIPSWRHRSAVSTLR